MGEERIRGVGEVGSLGTQSNKPEDRPSLKNDKDNGRENERGGRRERKSGIMVEDEGP